jgi:hypothetical protein
MFSADRMAVPRAVRVPPVKTVISPQCMDTLSKGEKSVYTWR